MANMVIKKKHAIMHVKIMRSMKVTITKNGSNDDVDLTQGMGQEGGKVIRPEIEEQFGQ